MKPERKIVKNLTLREISGVTIPAQSGAVVTIMKSADPVVTPPATFNPSEISPEGQSMLAKMLAATYSADPITKSATEESHNMSNETHYDRLVRSYSDRHGVSLQKAASKIMEDDVDAVTAAYDADEAELVARRFAEASRQ
ncbi:hypothetical protein HFO24_21235 [Rhizobium laguerreae]|uniref:hypothetical protein n=1 Tax=Rhizobium laguerreae TaxID=1076926 RepID=UPI001C91D784|nr:hypothetical protein [Rhizobium laguerreae]MBY3184169.1 hypothetical protein [Rhizobium laguerreae]